MVIPVTAAIISRANKILIARRSSNKHLAGYWEFPGGKIEEGETPETCLIREILEELEIIITVDSFCMETEHQYEKVTILLKAYFCTFISGEINLIDHDKIEWTQLDKLHEFTFAPADIPIVNRLTSN